MSCSNNLRSVQIPQIFMKKSASTNKSQVSISEIAFFNNITENCVGQDGAAAMVGRLSGVKTCIKAKYPKALLIYCGWEHSSAR